MRGAPHDVANERRPSVRAVVFVVRRADPESPKQEARSTSYSQQNEIRLLIAQESFAGFDSFHRLVVQTFSWKVFTRVRLLELARATAFSLRRSRRWCAD